MTTTLASSSICPSENWLRIKVHKVALGCVYKGQLIALNYYYQSGSVFLVCVLSDSYTIITRPPNDRERECCRLYGNPKCYSHGGGQDSGVTLPPGASTARPPSSGEITAGPPGEGSSTVGQGGDSGSELPTGPTGPGGTGF